MASSPQGMRAAADAVDAAVTQYAQMWDTLAAHAHIDDAPQELLSGVRQHAMTLHYFLSLSGRAVDRCFTAQELHADPSVLRPLLRPLSESLALMSHIGRPELAETVSGLADSGSDLIASLMLTAEEARAWLRQPEIADWMTYMRQEELA